MNGTPISKLQQTSNLLQEDKFLISEFNVSSDSMYYTRSISVGNIEASISADNDISAIRLSADTNISLLNNVSTDYVSVVLSTDDFTDKFENNEISTRMIPGLSSFTMQLISELSDTLYKDIIYYPKRDQNFNVLLKLFSKNYYQTAFPIAKFKIPDFMDGYSRHLYLIFNNAYDSLIFFSTNTSQIFFSDRNFDKLVPKGVHIFDIKEISKDIFYIKMNDISYNLGPDHSIGPVQARQELQEDSTDIDEEEFLDITSTWTPITTRLQQTIDAWGLEINSNGDHT